jgi:hypothetical protein
MESMPAPESAVTVGVDPHLDTHVAAVIDRPGGCVAPRRSRPRPAAMSPWSPGPSAWSGGADRRGRHRHLRGRAGPLVRAYDLQAVEVNRPDRSTRRRHGTSDPIHAQAAARATLAGVAATTPKTRDGQVAMIRVLRVARRGALKARGPPPSNSTACSPAPLKRCANPCPASRPTPWSMPVRPCHPGPHQHDRRHQDHAVDPGSALAATPRRTRPPRPSTPDARRRGRAHLVALLGVGSTPPGSCWSPPG